LGCKNVSFVKGNLLKPIEPPIDVVVSNPPYVPIGDSRLEESVLKFEPAVALFGGKDGLDVVRKLIKEAAEKLQKSGIIALEVGEGQSEAVSSLLEEHGFTKVERFKDLSGIERVLTAERA